MKHQLGLDVPDTLVSQIIHIRDASIYNSLVPYECPILEITPPGFVEPFVVEDLEQNFTVNLSACDIGLQTANCETYHNDFTDGIYVIKWSVSPNDKVYVEYNHLRITKALIKINEILCCLNLRPDYNEKIQEAIKQIQILTVLLKAAKAQVEFCHKPEQGMQMYNYVIKKLDKLACGCGCSSCK